MAGSSKLRLERILKKPNGPIRQRRTSFFFPEAYPALAGLETLPRLDLGPNSYFLDSFYFCVQSGGAEVSVSVFSLKNS